jgi:preprotein translocase subunit SecA
VVRQYVLAGTEGFAEDWDLEQLWTQLKTLYPVSLKRSDYEDQEELDREELIADFQDDARRAYDAREQELGPEVMRELERQVMLTVLDRKWREHLYEMDYLREGIGLRAMAQKDPLVEYQREGGEMYAQMMEAFKEEVVGYLYHLEVEVQREPAVGVVAGADGLPLEVGARRRGAGQRGGSDSSGGDGGSGNMRPLAPRRAPLIESGPDPDGPGVEISSHEQTEREPEPVGTATQSRPQISGKGLATGNSRAQQLAYNSANGRTGSTRAASKDQYAGVGRNQPCPCGSGKKFKMCHGASGSR